MLIVEGDDDLHFILNLCQKLGFQPEFEIKKAGSVDKAIKQFSLEIKNRGYPIGLVVDANGNMSERKKQIISSLTKYHQVLEMDFKDKGLIVMPDLDPRFGIWLWPDCSSPGILEDLYLQIVQEEDQLLEEAHRVVDGIAAIEPFRFKPQYKSKAIVHTWLAWQDNPGSPLGASVKRSIINHSHPTIQNFKNWLTRLYSNNEKTDD